MQCRFRKKSVDNQIVINLSTLCPRPFFGTGAKGATPLHIVQIEGLPPQKVNRQVLPAIVFQIYFYQPHLLF